MIPSEQKSDALASNMSQVSVTGILFFTAYINNLRITTEAP